MGSPGYYIFVMVASVAVGVLNIQIMGGGKGLSCYTWTDMDAKTLADFKGTFNGTTTVILAKIKNETDPDSLWKVRTPSSNLFPMLCMVLAFGYFGVGAFSIFMALLINCLANQLPEDFMNMGFLKRCMAAVCKVLPLVIVLIHWILLLPILGNQFFLMMGACEETTTTEVGVMIDSPKYGRDVSSTTLISLIVWLLLHCGGAILKDLTYTEPFIYWPIIGNSGGLTCCLKTLGP